MVGKNTSVVLLLILTLLCFLVSFQIAAHGVGTVDPDTYWVAARMILAGLNPYDTSQYVEFYRSAMGGSRHLMLVEKMHLPWNPPYAFTIFLPFSKLSFETFSALFLGINILASALSVYFSLKAAAAVFGQGNAVRILKQPFALLVVPPASSVLFALHYGQLASMMTFAVAAIIYLLLTSGGSDTRRLVATGITLSLLMEKPQLQALLIIYLLLPLSRPLRRGPIIAGFTASCLVLFAAPWLLTPEIYGWFLHSEHPFFWFNPSIGVWIQSFFPEHAVLRFLPFLISVVWLLLHGLKTYSHPKTIEAEAITIAMVLVPAGLVATPFLWHYDYVLLIPTLCFCLGFLRNLSSRLQNRVSLLLIFANSMSLTLFIEVERSVWYPILILAVSFLCAHRGKSLVPRQ